MHKPVYWVGESCGWNTEGAVSAGQKEAATLPSCFEDEGTFLGQLYAVSASMEDHVSEISV